KPELRRIPPTPLNWVKRSFCRSKHWITMAQEIINLNNSARQVSVAQHLGSLPIVSIKARSFFKPTLWTHFIPLQGANQLREKMHVALRDLSTDFLQMEAGNSGHFVWLDQPEVIVEAVKAILNKIKSSQLA
ncbi:MAG: alpha/beta hydrolase, partial [Leptolyngbyaceae cyanobacterium MO_188.B28]|nr:alpha/beta hydrolase [Leptolyngbyaceae cyanobacterium MO_188.B28]